LKGKKILLGITGSIAAYKCPELIRKFKKEGAEVKVVTTSNARNFVTIQTLRSVSSNPVYGEMFPQNFSEDILHVRLTEWADALLVAPATANVIGKTASGIGDDLLTSIILAFKGSLLFAPAMDEGMYSNPIFQENMKKLKKLGYHFVGPEKGELASGKVAVGRLASLDKIIQEVETLVSKKDDFKKVKVLVTAGGTREYLDSIRFIGNPSTGKMGYALASVARIRGAEVHLITAPTLLIPPEGVELTEATTAREMKDKVVKRFPRCNVLIMNAAVGDFRPERTPKHKKSRGEGKWNISLVPNPDILKAIAKQKKNKIVVGFSIETKNIVKKAQEKLKNKNMDLIVANYIGEKESGFASDTNRAVLIDKQSQVEKLPLLSKTDLAHKILDKIKDIQKSRTK